MTAVLAKVADLCYKYRGKWFAFGKVLLSIGQLRKTMERDKPATEEAEA